MSFRKPFLIAALSLIALPSFGSSNIQVSVLARGEGYGIPMSTAREWAQKNAYEMAQEECTARYNEYYKENRSVFSFNWKSLSVIESDIEIKSCETIYTEGHEGVLSSCEASLTMECPDR